MRRRRTKADRKDKDEIVRKRIVGPKLKITLSEKMEFCFSSQKNTCPHQRGDLLSKTCETCSLGLPVYHE